MLCLCLYVPVHISERIELQYFESEGLPAQLKSLSKLSLFLSSQELIHTGNGERYVICIN